MEFRAALRSDTFGKLEGIDDEWYRSYKVINSETGKPNIQYQCLINDCMKTFDRASNIRHHFNAHLKEK